MHNIATDQVQVHTDADLGSYCFKNKINIGDIPTLLFSKNKIQCACAS
jgi:hypothetical protein